MLRGKWFSGWDNPTSTPWAPSTLSWALTSTYLIHFGVWFWCGLYFGGGSKKFPLPLEVHASWFKNQIDLGKITGDWKKPKFNYAHWGIHRHRFQRKLGTRCICHPEPRRSLQTSKEKGRNSQKIKRVNVW